MGSSRIRKKGEESDERPGDERISFHARLRPPGGLVILGVIHRDRKAPPVLDQWMKAIEPDVITLEFSRYGMNFRRRHGPRYRLEILEICNELKKNDLPCYDNALSMVLSYVDMPYEFERASRYGADMGIPVIPIDMDCYSRMRLKDIGSFLARENLSKILSGESGRDEGYEHVLARLYFEEGITTVEYTEEMAVRDRYMSGKIGALKRRYRGKRFLHISGWRHLLDPEDAYGPYNPVKVFIYDKTFCI